MWLVSWPDPCVLRDLLQWVQQLPDAGHHGLLQPGQHQQLLQARLWRLLECTVTCVQICPGKNHVFYISCYILYINCQAVATMGKCNQENIDFAILNVITTKSVLSFRLFKCITFS
jgi:hypothetical protein